MSLPMKNMARISCPTRTQQEFPSKSSPTQGDSLMQFMTGTKSTPLTIYGPISRPISLMPANISNLLGIMYQKAPPPEIV